MKILIINHYAGSRKHGMEFRHFYLAGEWIRAGHDVQIVAASYSHLRSCQPAVQGKLSEETIDGIRYTWLRTICYAKNDLRRLANMLIYSLSLILNMSHILKAGVPNIVLVSSPHPFAFYGAYFIARRAKAKLVFEVRDLWPLTLVELGGMSLFNPLVYLMRSTERLGYRTSAKVVSLLPKAHEYMINNGLRRNKFSYIPNGINRSDWSQAPVQIPQHHQQVLSSLRFKKRFVVGYVGNHGLANALQVLVDAAALLSRHETTFLLIGQGPEKQNLQQKTQRLALRNVVFLPPIQKAAIPDLLSRMDVLYIGLKRKPLFKYGISPNKLMDYMMAAKPVISAIDAGNDLVAESGCGISVPAENGEAVAQAVLQLKRMTDKQLRTLGERGRKFVLKNHAYPSLAQGLLKSVP